jgi:hypothetical protein
MREIITLKTYIPGIIEAASSYAARGSSTSHLTEVVKHMQLAWYFWTDAAQITADAMRGKGDIVEALDVEPTAKRAPAMTSPVDFISYLKSNINELKKLATKVYEDLAYPSLMPRRAIVYLEQGLIHAITASYYINIIVEDYERTGRV